MHRRLLLTHPCRFARKENRRETSQKKYLKSSPSELVVFARHKIRELRLVGFDLHRNKERLICCAIIRASGDKKVAAELLGVRIDSFYRRLYNMGYKDFVVAIQAVPTAPE